MPPSLAPGPDDRAALARVALADPGHGPGFWKAVEASSLTQPQAAALRSTVALADLCSGDLELIRALQPRLQGEPDGTLAHLATMSANDWISIAAQARPNGSMSDIERMAGNLGEAIEVQHPSLTFKTKLDTGAVHIDSFPAAKVADFLGAHPDFDLTATAIEPFLIERRFQDAEVKKALLGTQRVLRLGPTQTEAIELMRAGLTSAQAIFSAGLHRLNALLGDPIDQTRVATLYDNAHQVVSATLGMASIVAPALTGPAIPALTSPSMSAVLLTRFPSLGAIFGDLSSRTCSHCASVLGPAAYLVDLLNTLSHAGAEAELRQRRPDIAQLELTCENTNTEVPYTDLVLEILENAITFPTGAITLTADQQDQLDAGTVPQPISSQLAATVSSLEGGITVLGAAEPGGVHDIAFVQGHRRWPAQRTRERLTTAPLARPTEAAVNEREVPEADRDVVRETLRQGVAAPQLIALLAPEPQLPVSGTPTITPLQKGRWPSGEGRQAYRIGISRAVAVKLVSQSAAGAVSLERSDGSPINTTLTRDTNFIQKLAEDLGQGRLPQYIANLLPPAAYEIKPDTGSAQRWILSAHFAFVVTYDPGQLVLTGLAYTGSASSRDLTVFAENRNPAAYTVLAAARYPWSLPFDVFTEEVRACLATLGTTRLDLIRALRPSLRNASVLDACEVLHTASEQIRQLTEPDAGSWGLLDTGNHLSEPSGDTSAPSIPGDWVGALSRLSVLLQRSRVNLPTLLGALGSRYVGGGAAPVLQPPDEDKPSRLTVESLTAGALSRLHQFLRLRLITGWSLRDLDAALDAVTDHFTTRR